MHFILPLMFIFDFILFDKKRVLKIYDPFISLIIPIVYVLYIFIISLLIDPNSNAIIYPYFFLDVNQLGYMGVLEWIGILLIVFIVIEYLFYLINYIQKKSYRIKNYYFKNIRTNKLTAIYDSLRIII